MSLQFIMGNSGSGKSYCLYDTVVREAIENPDKNYLVIVPEQFTMQTQKDLCLAHPKGGIMNIDVLLKRWVRMPVLCLMMKEKILFCAKLRASVKKI